MTRSAVTFRRIAFAVLFSGLCNAAADAPCRAFQRPYVYGEPGAGEDGLLLRFDPRNTSTGDTLFRGFAEVDDWKSDHYLINIFHRDADNKQLYFRPLRTGESADAVFRLEICPHSIRPILIRVELKAGKPVIYLEPLP